jgi:predicted nuclease of predicted toxin-antitoxin system
LEAAISLYLDENLSPRIAEQLKLRGVDAVSVRDLELLGDGDNNHLQRATQMGRVLVTMDTDFLRIAAEGGEHAGIVFGAQEDHSLGDWVKLLELLCFVYTAEEMKNHVEYL